MTYQQRSVSESSSIHGGGARSLQTNMRSVSGRDNSHHKGEHLNPSCGGQTNSFDPVLNYTTADHDKKGLVRPTISTGWCFLLPTSRSAFCPRQVVVASSQAYLKPTWESTQNADLHKYCYIAEQNSLVWPFTYSNTHPDQLSTRGHRACHAIASHRLPRP